MGQSIKNTDCSQFGSLFAIAYLSMQSKEIHHIRFVGGDNLT